MGETNTITWVTRDSQRVIQVAVSRVELQHTRGELEADRVLLVFDSGPYRYRMALSRGQDGRFEGPCQRFSQESGGLIDAKSIRLVLLDSLERSALVLGLTAWLDDDQEDSDWMGQFNNVHRVICH